MPVKQSRVRLKLITKLIYIYDNEAQIYTATRPICKYIIQCMRPIYVTTRPIYVTMRPMGLYMRIRPNVYLIIHIKIK